MSESSFYPQRRHRELQDVEMGKLNRDKDEEEDTDCLRQFSHCPACNQEYDIALMLPCSHTMCGRCITAREGKRSGQPHRGVSQTVCSVLCSECQHPVELPCWSWSCATSCLPQHPTLSPACVSRETGTREEAPQVRLFYLSLQKNNNVFD